MHPDGAWIHVSCFLPKCSTRPYIRHYLQRGRYVGPEEKGEARGHVDQWNGCLFRWEVILGCSSAFCSQRRQMLPRAFCPIDHKFKIWWISIKRRARKCFGQWQSLYYMIHKQQQVLAFTSTFRILLPSVAQCVVLATEEKRNPICMKVPKIAIIQLCAYYLGAWSLRQSPCQSDLTAVLPLQVWLKLVWVNWHMLQPLPTYGTDTSFDTSHYEALLKQAPLLEERRFGRACFFLIQYMGKQHMIVYNGILVSLVSCSTLSGLLR